MQRTILTLIVTFALVSVAAAGTATAPSGNLTTNTQTGQLSQINETNTSTASGYLTAFRELNGTEAFTQYSEFEIIRSQAVFAVQIGDFSRTDQERMELTLQVLETFDAAYQYQQDGEYDQAIKTANEASELSAQLRAVDGGERYAVLTDLSLERFYARIGQSLQTAAESESVTPERIRILRQAASAYQRSDATDRYSQVLLRVEDSEQTYRDDLESMNESVAIVTAFTEGCRDCGSITAAVTGYGVDVFSEYQTARTSTEEVRKAIKLAEKHGLTEERSSLEPLREETLQLRETLSQASAVAIVGYTLFLGLCSVLIAQRLMIWKNDLKAASYGDSVLTGAILRD